MRHSIIFRLYCQSPNPASILISESPINPFAGLSMNFLIPALAAHYNHLSEAWRASYRILLISGSGSIQPGHSIQPVENNGHHPQELSEISFPLWRYFITSSDAVLLDCAHELEERLRRATIARCYRVNRISQRA